MIDHIPVGLAVRICGFHTQGPGSTPGLGNFSVTKNSEKLRILLKFQ